MATATAGKPKAAAKQATKPKESKPKVTREPKPGATTKRPADLKKAQQQPLKGHDVTDAMVRRARDEWGIEPYVSANEWEAIKPASRGWIVHARLKSGHNDRTLCGTETLWVGGVTESGHGDLNCLWCMARIKAYGKAPASKSK